MIDIRSRKENRNCIDIFGTDNYQAKKGVSGVAVLGRILHIMVYVISSVTIRINGINVRGKLRQG